MPLQFSFVPEQDFSKGIDQYSAEAMIQPGYVEDALNVDIKERRLIKRSGYQTYAGSIPMRVEELTYNSTTDRAFLKLNNALDLTVIRDVPIVVYGRTSLDSGTYGGDFDTSDSGNYYTVISTDPRKTLSGSSTVINDHGFSSTDFLVGVVESLSPITYDNEIVWMDKVQHDKSTFDLTLFHTLNAPISSFVYYKDVAPSAGTNYQQLLSITDPGDFSGGFVIPNTYTKTITAGAHGLNNFNILVQIYAEYGNAYETVNLDAAVINNAGSVTFTYTINALDVEDVKFVLTALPTANVKLSAFSASDLVQTFTLTNQTSPFIFYALYFEDTITGDLTRIEPETVDYDATNQQYIFSVIIGVSTNIRLFYDFGQIQTNLIQIQPANPITLDGTDTTPQLTVWGIPHATPGIYGSFKVAREGWVNHIDSYKSSADKHVVAGLGGNLFAALPRTQLASDYLLPQLLTYLRNRIDADTKVGPLVRVTGDTYARSRGYLNCDNGTSNWLTVTDINYQTSGANLGYVKYTLTATNWGAFDSTGTPTAITNIVSTAANLEDWVTISQTGYERHTGTFMLKAIESIDANTIAMYVANSEVDSDDWDESDVGGLAGVFTDQLPLDTDSYFIPGDVLLADLFTDLFIYSVLSTTTSRLVFSGATSDLSIPIGLRISGRRTSSVIPMRTTTDSPTVIDFVTSDNISYPYIDRMLEILSVNAKTNISVSITGDGTTATVTLGTGDTNFLPVGQKVILAHAGQFTGVVEVNDVLSLSQFTFMSSETGTVATGVIQGACIQIDEELEWYDDSADTTTLTVDRRWIPIEAPDDSYDTTPSQHTYYFDSNSYTEQPFLRSVMVSDNLYLTNGSDEVLKYDGTSIYRAGLFRWQPGLFISVKTGGNVTVPVVSVAGTSSGSTFTVTNAGEEENLSEGQSVFLDSVRYTIVNINTTTHTILMDRTIASGTSIVANTATYRYYYRLNAIDANNNIVASAVTGQEDARVELTQSSDIQHKLVGFPSWDNYDYDRIELEIYRTKRDQQAPFYKVVTLPVTFESTTGYLNYTDTAVDDALVQLDAVNTSLLGAEVGTGWEEPLKAKYITTANNSLVLANITDYPQLDLVIDGANATVSNCNGLKWQFERVYNAIAPTVTDNVDTLILETRNTGDIAATVAYVNTTSFQVSVSASLNVGDWVYLFYKNSSAPTALNIEPAGWWQIGTVTTPGSVYTVTNTTTSASFPGTLPNRALIATNSANVPIYINTSTPAGYDYNYQTIGGQPVNSNDEKNIVMNRMANAINSVMRKCQTTDFVPWIVANSDGSYGNGQMVVRQPKVSEQDFYFRFPNTTAFNLYGNGLRYPASSYVQSAERIYPSRLLVSYTNYPEIFDNPTSILPQDSDSVIDVNPADGQEITGVIPFFGDTAFGAAQKGSVVVCFKQQSIYLVDLAVKAKGDNTNAVQKLESQGLGCTAPGSIAVTKDGIIFANEAGIYRLNRDLSIEYLGKMIERLWLEDTRRTSDMLAIMQGHHYAIGKTYKLSVPTNLEVDNPDQIYVYHHSSEPQQGAMGGWTRYDDHSAIGWCNLLADAYFCDVNGRVASIRRVGDPTDFRDAHAAVDAVITSRALDFGAPGIRKVFGAIITHYRANLAQISGTTLTYSYDLQEEFRETDDLIITRTTSTTGISDSENQKGRSILSELDRKRAVYFQVRYTNDTLDEPMDIAGFTIRVAGLSDKGILQAAQTTRSE